MMPFLSMKRFTLKLLPWWNGIVKTLWVVALTATATVFFYAVKSNLSVATIEDINSAFCVDVFISLNQIQLYFSAIAVILFPLKKSLSVHKEIENPFSSLTEFTSVSTLVGDASNHKFTNIVSM